ncbi:MAG TPA: hypothetical protein VGQ99_09595 [Tepidisphaeraceae bacterium]|jgi:DNA-directed RNA polymerase subunit RPC12/RpoP|nr:hypothetical protein [Tepidisphaeraceae bacterium]
MKKSEMEAHCENYHALMARAQAAERSGLFRVTVDVAISAFGHIDGMMQFERKYEEKEFVSVTAVEVVLRYAPLLFCSEYLDKLESLLGEYRRIERDTSADLAAKVAEARARMWNNHRLWGHLELHPETRQDELRQILGGEQEYWRSVIEAWEKMGLVRRTPERGSYRLALSTRMGEVVRGKCPKCAQVAEAPKAMLLDEVECKRCGGRVLFVLLAADAS